jgi:hypothetical protein
MPEFKANLHVRGGALPLEGEAAEPSRRALPRQGRARHLPLKQARPRLLADQAAAAVRRLRRCLGLGDQRAQRRHAPRWRPAGGW